MGQGDVMDGHLLRTLYEKQDSHLEICSEMVSEEAEVRRIHKNTIRQNLQGENSHWSNISLCSFCSSSLFLMNCFLIGGAC